MKTELNLETWNRKEHFNFFSKFEEPFFGLTVRVDCTTAYQKAKTNGQSFFLYYLYRILKAGNAIEPFRYRIHDQKVFVYDQLNASPTVNRPDGTFGFAYLNYAEDEELFYTQAKQTMDEVRNITSLFPPVMNESVIHFSAVPWLDFSSISHARSFSFADSCPKISVGKMTEQNGVRTMPVSIHVHHALMDGYHVGLFVEKLQELLNEV